jgi:hypothetical protein
LFQFVNVVAGDGRRNPPADQNIREISVRICDHREITVLFWTGRREAPGLEPADRVGDPDPMAMTSCRRTYDHRIRELASQAGDASVARHLGIPKSTSPAAVERLVAFSTTR